MEIQLCEDVHKNLQPLVFNDLDSENRVPGAVCDEPNFTSSTSTLIIDEATSPDNTMDASTSTLVIDETISSDITVDATIPTQIIDEAMSSDNTNDNTMPKLVTDETTSSDVSQVTPRRSERARKPIQKLNL